MKLRRVINPWWCSLFLLLVLAGAFWRMSPRSYVSPPEPAGNTEGESLASGPVNTAGTNLEPRTVDAAQLAEDLGIEITALQVGVAGIRLDLRYRVLEPTRAVGLTNWLNRAYLRDSSGRNLSLPHSPSGTPLRQDSGQPPRVGRIYSHFFPNPGGAVKPGDSVTLVIGNLRTENLVVR